MRFDDRVTGNLKTYAPNAKKIHIDIDPSEINKNVPVDVAPRRRPARRAQAPDAVGRAGQSPARGCGTSTASRETAAVRDIQACPTTGTSMPRTSSTTSGARRDGSDTIVVTDVGQHQMWEAQYYHHEAPRSLITSGGLGTMGFAAAGGDRRQDGAARSRKSGRSSATAASR